MAAMVRALVVVLLMVLITVRPAYATVCARADPWFVERILVETSSLPPGVSVRGLDERAGAEQVNDFEGDVLWIGNSSPTAVYLLAEREAYRRTRDTNLEDAPPDPSPTLIPPGMVAVYKVSAEGAFWWGRYATEPGRQYSWQVFGRSGEVAVNRSLLPAAAPGLKDLNRRDQERPAAPELPPPQRGHLFLVHAARVVTVPVDVAYAVNPYYDPVRGGCPSTLTFLGLLLLLPVALSVGLILWWWNRRAQAREAWRAADPR